MARRSWFLGYLTLVGLMLGSAALAAYLGYTGLELYIGETSRDIESPGAFVNQSANLEAALLRWSFASLCALTTIVSFFALIRSIFEDVARAGRGSIDANMLGDELNAQIKAQGPDHENS